MVEDRASRGNCSPRFGSWFANTDLEEDGELAPRWHRDVAVAVPRVSHGQAAVHWIGSSLANTVLIVRSAALGEEHLTHRAGECSQFYRHS